MVDPEYPMGGKLVTYDWLDPEWRKAVKDQIDRLNAYDPDITRHPWALYRLIKVNQPGRQNIEGVTMVMQWQEVEPVRFSGPVEASPAPYVPEARVKESRLTCKQEQYGRSHDYSIASFIVQPTKQVRNCFMVLDFMLMISCTRPAGKEGCK